MRKTSQLYLVIIINAAFLLQIGKNSCADDINQLIALTLDQYEQKTKQLKETQRILTTPVADAFCQTGITTADLAVASPTNTPVDEFDAETKELIAQEKMQLASAELAAPAAGGLPEDNFIDVLDLKEMEITDVLKLISEKSRLNIIAGQGVSGKVTIYLRNVRLKDALRIILDSNNMAYYFENGIVRVMPAKEYEARFGNKFGGDIQTRIVRLEYAEVTDLSALLNQMKSQSGKIITDNKSATLVLMDNADILTIMEDLIRRIDVPVETAVFELSYAFAEDISKKAGEALTPNIGKIKFDKRSNKIIVTDTPNKIREIDKIIHSFDVQEQQVLIEAKIVQIVLNDQYKFGVNWEAIVANYHSLSFTSAFDILGSTDKRGKVSIGTLDHDKYTGMLEALQTVGKTNILSSPSITAINNQEAKMLVGSTQPYVTTTVTTPASGPTTVAESVNFIDVGVKLYVTPTIHKDNFITMKIRPEVSSVTSNLKTSNNNTIPIVDTSQAETTVMVKHGVTIVIGGLIKEEKLSTVNKVPILGSLPLLGHAFRNTDNTVRKTEIVIFLTPKIITGDIPTPPKEDAALTPPR